MATTGPEKEQRFYVGLDKIEQRQLREVRALLERERDNHVSMSEVLREAFRHYVKERKISIAQT